MKNNLLLSLFVGSIVFSFSCDAPKYPPAMSVKKSLESFMIDDRFEVQVFAAEPMVQDPVSMIFDEKGDIYVVEMPDYPFKPEEGPGAGRVKKLLDTDGDGVKIGRASCRESVLIWGGGWAGGRD